MNPPRQLLIVDDDDAIRLSLMAFFEDEDSFIVQSAPDGETALKIVATEPITAAIVDMRLPKMNGVELILAMHAVRPSLQVLIYTGSAEFELPPELKSIGIVQEQVFLKPVERLSLLSEALLERLPPEMNT